MIHEIATCLWFDKNAKEAADFYKDTFSDFEPISENPIAVNYQLLGRRFMHLNGGPGYPINPSISFFINLEEENEIRQTWEKLTENGTVLMPSLEPALWLVRGSIWSELADHEKP